MENEAATQKPDGYPQHSDPVLREVWRIKQELSEQDGHDVDTMFRRARESQRLREERGEVRVVDLSERAG